MSAVVESATAVVVEDTNEIVEGKASEAFPFLCPVTAIKKALV